MVFLLIFSIRFATLNSFRIDKLVTEGEVQYTVPNASSGEAEKLDPLPIWAEFELVPQSMLVLSYRGHVNKSALFAANGDQAQQSWNHLKSEGN